jgi:hypothetical protein
LEAAVSRTDKTKPHKVRVLEHHPWAEHFHDEGFCDLPPSPLAPNGTINYRVHVRPDGSSYRTLGCYWSDWNVAGRTCCSGGCSGRNCPCRAWRAPERRRRRAAGKREARRELMEANGVEA